MASPKPTAARLTITDENGKAHEIALNPAFGAVLLKAIKQGPSRISLQGCLPPGSEHATPERKHWQIFPQGIGVSDLQGWSD